MIIYKALNKKNGKCYIGQTVKTLRKRSMSHIRAAKNKEKDYPFHRALLKYGEENFEWCVLCECQSKEEMDKMENYYIKKLKSHASKNGYNLTLGGGGNNGWIPSEETKKRIRDSNIGRRKTKEQCEEQSQRMMGSGNPMFGVKRPECSGKNNPACRPEVSKKISEALKGKKKPYMIERNKQNIGKTYEKKYGVDKAEEIRLKMSLSHMGKLLGTKRTEHQKNKQREKMSKYEYTITSPDGITEKTNSIRLFVTEHNVDRNWLQKACKGTALGSGRRTRSLLHRMI